MSALMIPRRSRHLPVKHRKVMAKDAMRLYYPAKEWFPRLRRVQHIRTSVWCDFIHGMPGEEFISHFRVEKREFSRIMCAIGWPVSNTLTRRNEYQTRAKLTTLIVSRRLFSPCRWIDITQLYKKHPSHLSGIFGKWFIVFMV